MLVDVSSYEIGNLFEKASQQMLLLLFEAWGYTTETLETRRQKSGTQHGFDVYLKVYDSNFLPIHIFIECKGSGDLNTIDKHELIIKNDQLKRNTFPVKDIHLFFSPTRAINYSNDEIPIEEDQNPFCVIDMMRREGQRNDVLNLFMTYAGNATAIIDYRKQILSLIDQPQDPVFSFEESVSILKKKFHSSLEAYLSIPGSKDIILLTPSFWNQIKSKSNLSRLPDYFIRLDSVKSRLLDVVANDYHISNTIAKKSFIYYFEEIKNQNGGLIKILSNGGEGKSTFLLEISKELCQQYPVFHIQEWNSDTLDKIKRQLSLLGTDLIPVLLLDDGAHYENLFEEYGEEIANWPDGMVLIVAERYYRYQKMRGRESFECLFQNEPVQFNFQSTANVAEIFEKFFSQLSLKFTILTTEDYEKSRQHFLVTGKYTIAERIFMVLRYLHQNKRIDFQFDWDEWNEIHKTSPLKYLYLLVSAFFQFGNSITIDFCVEFTALDNCSAIDIRNAVDSSPNQPIVRNGEFLQLRHEKIAQWYIEEEKQQENVRAIYREWMEKMNKSLLKNH